MMKYFFPLLTGCLLVASASCQSGQQQWYYISTEKLFRFSWSEHEIWWQETGLEAVIKGGKENRADLLITFTEGQKRGYIHRDKDSSEAMPYGMSLFIMAPDSSFMDLDMECSANTYTDTATIRSVWQGCPPPGKMVMRFYSEKTIQRFRQMPPVEKMSREETDQVRLQFNRQKEALVKEYGEDKLLWVAPIIFQQVLTDMLLQKGFCPLITAKQAETMFDFNFF